MSEGRSLDLNDHFLRPKVAAGFADGKITIFWSPQSQRAIKTLFFAVRYPGRS
jgi:hypothetical protein